jgi:hypothetical protein
MTWAPLAGAFALTRQRWTDVDVDADVGAGADGAPAPAGPGRERGRHPVPARKHRPPRRRRLGHRQADPGRGQCPPAWLTGATASLDRRRRFARSAPRFGRSAPPFRLPRLHFASQAGATGGRT